MTIYELLEYSNRYDREGSLLYLLLEDAKKKMDDRLNEYLSWNTSGKHSFRIERPSELEAKVYDTWIFNGEHRECLEATFSILKRTVKE